MEKKFRTLSAYLPSRRAPIPPALPFALQNGYGTSAATRDIAAGISGQTCPATASGMVTGETAHPASGVVPSGGGNCAPMARPGSTAGTRQSAAYFDYPQTAAARAQPVQSRFYNVYL